MVNRSASVSPMYRRLSDSKSAGSFAMPGSSGIIIRQTGPDRAKKCSGRLVTAAKVKGGRCPAINEKRMIDAMHRQCPVKRNTPEKTKFVLSGESWSKRHRRTSAKRKRGIHLPRFVSFPGSAWERTVRQALPAGRA
jgi:hypothetical protein